MRQRWQKFWDRIAPSEVAPIPETASEFYINSLLPNLRLFYGLDKKALKEIRASLEWFSLPGGWPLIRQGEIGDSLFVIVSGALGVFIKGADGRTELVTQLSTGAAVGEMSLLTGEKRSATLTAIRDTELLRLPKEAFERLSAAYPILLHNLAAILAQRLAITTHGEEEAFRPRTFSVFPYDKSIPCTDLCYRLNRAFAAHGGRIPVITSDAKDRPTEWFHQMETDHDHVLYQADPDDGVWTRLCLRQSDRILLIVPASERPRSGDIERLFRGQRRRRLEIVFYHKNGSPTDTVDAWLEAFPDVFHHHIRQGNDQDIARLSRHFIGRATGLVLAGGGARGFAHLGALKAIREAGVNVDILGGTSMGGIIAAGIAMDWSHDELVDRMRRAFVDANPISDYTIPRIALVRGRKVTALLKEHFADTQIENLWRPYFCVSSNLTTGQVVIHRRGPIWQALRASVAIPGLLPPVSLEGEVLVDGAVMNNFPADIMSDFGRGPVIGIDVEGNQSITAAEIDQDSGLGWRTLDDSRKQDPGIINILMRAGTVNSEAQTKLSRRMVDIYFSPNMEGIGIRDWHMFDEAIERGYTHTQDVIEQVGASLFSR